MPILYKNKFPELLTEIYDPPEKLYYFGNIDLIYKSSISIVGTRKSTEYGEYVTNKIVEELSNYDLNIVSGLAKGIDTIAHKAALKNNLSTIAVLGSGFKNIYPKVNIDLARKIAQKGLLISEFPNDETPKQMNFPKRNRIISAVSLATIIIEAPEKSGALITADFALEHGREIFTVPGDIDQPNSQGPLKLLKESAAHPISSGQDVIDVLKEKIRPKFKNKKIESIPSLKINPKESQILAAISKARARSFRSIQKKSKLPISELLSQLSLLEIRGLIKKKNGKYIRSI